MNTPIVKPNVLALALLATGIVIGMAFLLPAEHAVAVIGLASVALGAFGSVMFVLSAPPPNPDVEARFASDLLALAAGTGTPQHEAMPGSARAPPILLILIGIAAVISLVAFLLPTVPTTAAVGIANATVGAITGLVGKLAEPEPDRAVPQSIVIAALKQIADTKAGK